MIRDDVQDKAHLVLAKDSNKSVEIMLCADFRVNAIRVCDIIAVRASGRGLKAG